MAVRPMDFELAGAMGRFDRGRTKWLGVRHRLRLAEREKSRYGSAFLANPSESVQCKPLEVQVGDKGIERAIKHLKRKMAAEGILRELKRRRHYMKPSIKRRKKMSEAARRRRKRLKTEERI